MQSTTHISFQARGTQEIMMIKSDIRGNRKGRISTLHSSAVCQQYQTVISIVLARRICFSFDTRVSKVAGKNITTFNRHHRKLTKEGGAFQHSDLSQRQSARVRITRPGLVGRLSQSCRLPSRNITVLFVTLQQGQSRSTDLFLCYTECLLSHPAKCVSVSY